MDNLRAPDIVALEEVQDNDGPTNNTGPTANDANLTYQTLIEAIQRVGGPRYDYRQIDPQEDQDGGEPGGNIRVGFLFRADRPGLRFVDRADRSADLSCSTQPTDERCATTATTVLRQGRRARLSLSPGRIDPTNSAFENSRKPLAGEFRFRGRRLFVIANHFNSKGGDDPLFGRFQPPERSSEEQRRQQAQIVNAFVANILQIDPEANVVALGDFNDFEFSPSLKILETGSPDGSGSRELYNLYETLPANERYSYVFQGNSQVLDHTLVSRNLRQDAAVEYDVVHVNAEFADQISDHDPQVSRFGFRGQGSGDSDGDEDDDEEGDG